MGRSLVCFGMNDFEEELHVFLYQNFIAKMAKQVTKLASLERNMTGYSLARLSENQLLLAGGCSQ